MCVLHPEMQVPPAISSLRPEHLHHKLEKKKMSAPGDGHRYQMMVIIYCNIVLLKTIPPNVYGQITLNNGKESMKKVTSREPYTITVTWTNKLTLMMRRGYELIPQFLAVRWLPIQQEQFI